MPKHKITFKDKFIFNFPKISAGSEEDKFLIPPSVIEHFIKNGHKTILKDKNYSFYPTHLIDIEVEPSYLFEVTIRFSGVKLGGIVHGPNFMENSIFEIVSIDEIISEDEDYYYVPITLNGTLTWDFKVNWYQNYLTHVVEKGSNWENAKAVITLNFRNNPLIKQGLQKFIKENSSDVNIQKYSSLLEIFEKTPNIYSSICNFLQDSTRTQLKYWQYLKEKEFTMEGAYLGAF